MKRLFWSGSRALASAQGTLKQYTHQVRGRAALGLGFPQTQGGSQYGPGFLTDRCSLSKIPTLSSPGQQTPTVCQGPVVTGAAPITGALGHQEYSKTDHGSIFIEKEFTQGHVVQSIIACAS